MSEHDVCPDVSLLTRLAQGTLAVEEQRRVARHVDSCARCRQALAQQRQNAVPSSSLRSEDTGIHPEHPTLFQTRSLRTRGVVEPDAVSPPLVTPLPPVTPPPEPPPFPFLGPATRPDSLGRLGPYEITRLIGQGGMGIVFLAEDEELRRPVAVKVMSPDLARDPFARQRFVREARATAAVSSPHIVTIYRVSQDNDVPYLAMEYLHGEPLDRWLDHVKMLTPAQAVRLGRGIAAGLAAAHEAGLIHRDIKPANIWIDERPSAGDGLAESRKPKAESRVKILDFGLARSAQDNLNLTQSGLVVGTPAYMAPEQADGEPVDARSDLFSLGCVLYRLCTGQAPFTGPTVMAVLKAIALRDPLPPREVNPAVPGALSDLIVWLLSKNPARRPGSAREVEQMLAKIEKDLEAAGEEASLGAVEMLPPNRAGITPVPDARSAVFGAAADSNPTDPVLTTSTSGRAATDAAASPPRRRLTTVILVALGLAAGVALTAVLMHRTEKGTLELDLKSSVADARVLVERDGQCVAVLDSAAPKAFLATGEYVLRAEDADQFEVSPRSVHVSHGEPISVRVRANKAAPVTPDPDEAWRKSVAAMPPAAQIEEVAIRFRRRNPDFMGRPDLRIENDAVTQAWMPSTDVVDLSALRALPKLSILVCNQNSGMGELRDIRPLRGLSLQTIHIAGNNVSDLTPLARMPLKTLIFMYNPVRDISPLRGMPLETLSFRGAQVRDLGPVKGMPLRHLNLAHNPVTDLSPLAGNSVAELVCDFVPIRDLSPLKGLKLHLLQIAGTGVEDISILKELPLKEVCLDIRSSADLEVLKAIPTLEKVNEHPAAEYLAGVERDLAELKDADAAVSDPPADAATTLRFSRLLTRYFRADRAESLLSAHIAKHGDPPELLQERGRLRARAGRWALAADDYERAYERRPDQPMLGQVAAYLRLQAGDRNGYRRICEHLLKDYSNTSDTFTAMVVTLACVQDPSVGHVDALLRLGDVAVKGAPGNGIWQFAGAAALYRAGRYADSAGLLEPGLPSAPPHQPWALCDHVVMAMDQHRLGNTRQARRYLERASLAHDKQLTLFASAPFVPLQDEYWWDTISFLILRREAEALLETTKP
jgi:serine/threonine protein kinase